MTAPLGTFSVDDQRNLFAPLGSYIPDVNPDELLFQQQVYEEAHNTPERIIALMARYAASR